MSVLTSRDNPKVKRWAKLASDVRFRRSEKRALIEGPHLLAAALEHGCKPQAVLATEEGATDAEISLLIAKSALRPVLVSKNILRMIADSETPQGVAAEIAIPQPGRQAEAPAVFLENVQDPGNVGAILRSAAAFGVKRVVLDRACADAWSPKALRAGMGGHFALRIDETDNLEADLERLSGNVACAVPKGGVNLQDALLKGPLAWVFGGEGRGLSEHTLRRATVRVTIPMAAGSESLNVAAAAAICLYETFSRSGAGS